MRKRWWRCDHETYLTTVLIPVNPQNRFDGWICRGRPGDVGVFVSFDKVRWLDETGPVALLEIYCSEPPAGNWTPLDGEGSTAWATH